MLEGVKVSYRWVLRWCLLGVLAMGLQVPGAWATDRTPEQLKQLEGMAKAGNDSAQNDLATYYFIRSLSSEKQDFELAIYWYRRAAALGNANAVFNLGLCYERGLGVKQDLKMALDHYRQAADMGLEKAQLNTALTLKEMQGMEEAAKYFEMAANQGNVVCQREIGKMYVTGQGVEQDIAKGLGFLTRSAGNGDLQSMLFLADCYSGSVEGIEANPRKMFDYLWDAAAQNSPEAISKIGFCYESGIGRARDTTVAVKWYKRAVEMGHAPAMLNLAHCYAVGQGVPKDPREAFLLYQKAAATGHPLAYYNLGVCHAMGEGTEVSASKAVAAFTRAAQAGVLNAQFALGTMYADGNGLPQDLELAFYWYRQAADQGHAESLTALAWAYYRGEGIPADRAKAKQLFEMAAARQSEEAIAALGQLFP